MHKSKINNEDITRLSKVAQGCNRPLAPHKPPIGEAIDEAIRILRKVKRGEIQLKETKLEGLIKNLHK